MKRPTHAASGVLLATLVSTSTSHEITFIALLWAVLWSVVSDFDVYIPFLKHRGFTHTLAFALLSGALVLVFGRSSPQAQFYALLASLSVLTHLLVDSLNPSGVPLWMPFSKKRVIFPIIGGLVRYDNWAANVGIQLLAIGAAIIIASR